MLRRITAGLGHHAEQRQHQLAFDILGNMHSVVKLALEEDNQHRQHSCSEQRKYDILHQVGRGWRGWCFGLVNDRNVAGAESSSGVQLFEALEQPIIQRAIGISFTGQQIILHQTILLGQGFRLEPIDLIAEGLFG